jgi:hypothetical protein
MVPKSAPVPIWDKLTVSVGEDVTEEEARRGRGLEQCVMTRPYEAPGEDGVAEEAAPVAGVVLIPAGLLDVDPGVRPMRHIFVGVKAGWFGIHDDLPRFETKP